MTRYIGEAEHYAGVDLPELREGELAMGAVVLLKVLTSSGSVVYREVKTPELHYVEALGMASTYVDTCRKVLTRSTRDQG